MRIRSSLPNYFAAQFCNLIHLNPRWTTRPSFFLQLFMLSPHVCPSFPLTLSWVLSTCSTPLSRRFPFLAYRHQESYHRRTLYDNGPCYWAFGTLCTLLATQQWSQQNHNSDPSQDPSCLHFVSGLEDLFGHRNNFSAIQSWRGGSWPSECFSNGLPVFSSISTA